MHDDLCLPLVHAPACPGPLTLRRGANGESAMQYRIFPATGDSLSVLGFGAMGFAGWFGRIEDNDAIRALHTALELGVNVVDTARAYGRSEQVVGAALRAWSGPRPFVATKIQPRGPQHQFGAPAPVEEVPKGWVTESCETSLRELGLESVDLMQLHLYWPTWGHDGYWMDELQALKQAGKARSVGISIRTTGTTAPSPWSRVVSSTRCRRSCTSSAASRSIPSSPSARRTA